jgi:hypothetical protein
MPNHYSMCKHADINRSLEINCKLLNLFVTWIDSSVDRPLPDKCPYKNDKYRIACDLIKETEEE